MPTICETKNLKLVNEYESTRLIEKSTGKVLLEDNFYGGAQCGLIDVRNNWAIVGGEHLIIWTPGKTKKIDRKLIEWVHALRAKDSETVEILIDPWRDNSAIWEINIRSFDVRKLKDCHDYKDKEYTDDVIW